MTMVSDTTTVWSIRCEEIITSKENIAVKRRNAQKILPSKRLKPEIFHH